MHKTKLKQLIILLDKMISAFDEMITFFTEKREVLKKSKSDELGIIDNKIIAQRNLIVKINSDIKNISTELINKEGNMSDFINFAKEEAVDFVEPLKERQTKIHETSDKLTLLNKQNVELMKHGITMTDKMLETIVDAFAPQGSIYDETGKTDKHDLNLWTINEEI